MAKREQRDRRFTAPLFTAQAAGVHLGIPANTSKQWIAGSKVPVEAIADLFYGGGESVDDIADEYGLTTAEVEAVLRVMARRAA